MAQEVSIPRLGWGMEKGTFVEWRKRHGERVDEGEVLFVLEGDKATQEIESLGRGVLHVVGSAPAPGDEVAVGRVIAFLLEPGEAPPADSPAALSGPAPRGAEPQVRAPVAAPEPRPHRRQASSPRARRVARELGVEIARLRGSGSSGRVTERDVRRAARLPPAPGGGWSSLAVEADAGRLAELARGVSAAAGGEPDGASVVTALLVRLAGRAAASRLPGRTASVGVGRVVAGALEWVVVRAAERAGVLELARRLGGARGVETAAPSSLDVDLLVFDAGGMGADAYEPGTGEGRAPLIVVGRPRAAGRPIPVTLRFPAGERGGARVAEAAGLLADVREAIEAPDLWLAR